MPEFALQTQMAKLIKNVIPSFVPPLRRHAAHLVGYDLDGAAGQDTREGIDVARERRGVGEQAIDRHQSGDCWKYCEQHKEGHSAGDRGDSIFRESVIKLFQQIEAAALPERTTASHLLTPIRQTRAANFRVASKNRRRVLEGDQSCLASELSVGLPA